MCFESFSILVRPDLIGLLWYNGSRLAVHLNGTELPEGQGWPNVRGGAGLSFGCGLGNRRRWVVSLIVIRCTNVGTRRRYPKATPLVGSQLGWGDGTGLGCSVGTPVGCGEGGLGAWHLAGSWGC